MSSEETVPGWTKFRLRKQTVLSSSRYRLRRLFVVGIPLSRPPASVSVGFSKPPAAPLASEMPSTYGSRFAQEATPTPLSGLQSRADSGIQGADP